jgi:hypothetical protein
MLRRGIFVIAHDKDRPVRRVFVALVNVILLDLRL